jgi:YD repeat-containing protein
VAYLPQDDAADYQRRLKRTFGDQAAVDGVPTVATQLERLALERAAILHRLENHREAGMIALGPLDMAVYRRRLEYLERVAAETIRRETIEINPNTVEARLERFLNREVEPIRTINDIPADALLASALAASYTPERVAAQRLAPFEKAPYMTEIEALVAVKADGLMLGVIPEELRTAKVALAAVQENPHAMQYVPKAMHTEGLALEAVTIDGEALRWVAPHASTRDVAVVAVANNLAAIRYVTGRDLNTGKPSEDVRDEIVAEARQRRAELIRTGKMPNARVDDDFAKVRPDIPMGHRVDADGRPLSFKGSDGFWEAYKRDAAGREVSFADSDGGWRKITHDDASNIRTIRTGGEDGHWEEVVQDQDGRELTRVDSRGHRREMTRDDTGRVLKMKCIDSKGDWNETTRDANGRELTYKTNTGFLRETTRDDAGRAIKIKISDADGSWQESVRNAKGAEVSYKDSSGAWREATFDKDGNKLTQESGVDAEEPAVAP